jgi:flagellar basal body-associated protein FliL
LNSFRRLGGDFMIDPISAVAVASAAFKGVQQLVSAGREMEDVMGQLGKWFGAVSDFRRAEQENKNPPLFKKLLFSGSVEEEALNIFAQKKKIQQQEYELMNIISMYYGPESWEELVTLRRQIRAEREKTVYKQARSRRKFIDGILIMFLCGLCIALVVGMIAFVVNKTQEKNAVQTSSVDIVTPYIKS